MAGHRNAFRYIDLKCNLSGVCLKFERLGKVVKVGEKLGCGAYGDVFRGHALHSHGQTSTSSRGSDSGCKRRMVNAPADVGAVENRQVLTDFDILQNRLCDAITIHTGYDYGEATNCAASVIEDDDDGDEEEEEVVENNHDDDDDDDGDVVTGGATGTTSGAGNAGSTSRSGQLYAIKYFKDDTLQINAEGFAPGTIRELSIMKCRGGHANIIRLIDVFVGPHEGIRQRLNAQASRVLCGVPGDVTKCFPLPPNQIFVLGLYEYCRGGDLGRSICRAFSKSNCDGFTLDQVKWYSYQLLNGIAHLHSFKIEHRDLKPNNIMLDSDAKYSVLKIGDWGLGREFPALEGTITPTACTMFYRPIEVILGPIKFGLEHNRGFSYNYGINADIWSAACLIAEMATGQPLFHGNSDFQVLTRITTTLGRPTEEEWRNCSNAEHYPFGGSLYAIYVADRRENLNVALKGRMDSLGIDLLLKMLNYNPHARISALEALSHPWFDDVDFKRLDSMGVTHCLEPAFRGRFGSKVLERMECASRGITTTCLLSHVIYNLGRCDASLLRVLDSDLSRASVGLKNFGLAVKLHEID